jgi:ribose transport system substrate-binding protein
MKKSLMIIVVVVMIATMVMSISFTGCKAITVDTAGAAAVTTAAAAAETTAAAATAAEATVVAGTEGTLKAEYRFVQIPILVQSWFDQVFKYSQEAADILGPKLGTKITWELQSPQEADVVVQNQLFEAAVATKPDGIAIDCNDPSSQLSTLEAAAKQGVPVVQYVSYSPEGSIIPYVGLNWYNDGMNVGSETIKRLEQTEKWKAGEKVKVCIIQGVPTNSAHAFRYQATKDLIAKYPDNIEIVAEVFDYDDVENAKEEASRALAANPDLDAYFTCDAAGPVGAALAIKEANKIGKIILVGHDTLPALAQLMLDGVLDLSLYADVQNFGYWVTAVLLMQNLGLTPPHYVDTGFKTMTPENAKDFLQM